MPIGGAAGRATVERPAAIQSGSGYGRALSWFLAIGLIRALGRELGWSDRPQVIAVVVALVLVVLIVAAASKPRRSSRVRPATP